MVLITIKDQSGYTVRSYSIQESRAKPGQTYVVNVVYSIGTSVFENGSKFLLLEQTEGFSPLGLICSLGNWKISTDNGVFIASGIEQAIAQGYLILQSDVIKCECGGDTARTTHSTWCPKHEQI